MEVGSTPSQIDQRDVCIIVEASRNLAGGYQELRITSFEDLDASTIEVLCLVAAEGFRQRVITDGLRSDVLNHLRNAGILYLLYNERHEVSGFVCLDIIPYLYGEVEIQVLHIQGIVLNSLARGLGRDVVAQLVNLFNVDAIAFHTVSEPMRRLGEKVGGVYDPYLAYMLADRLGSDRVNLEIRYTIDYPLIVERRRYGGPLYGVSLNGHRISGVTEDEEALGHAGVFAFLL